MQPVIIKARTPFNFSATAKFLRFTDKEIVDRLDAGGYRRLIHLGGEPSLLSVAPHGTRLRPALQLRLTPEPTASRLAPMISAAELVVRRIFSVDHDLREFESLVADDSVLNGIVAAHHGLRLARWPSLFESLVISILLQQISTQVAMTLKRRLVERFGARLELEGEVFFAFPCDVELARATLEDLRALGISTAKALSMLELARLSADGRLNPDELKRQDNETIIAGLSRLRGVGRWTAEWALILYFGRTDVFPAGDLALRGVVIKYYNNSVAMSEREVRFFAEKRWRGWASYVTVYIFAGLRAGILTLRPQELITSTAPRHSADMPQEQRRQIN